jgi:predicted kinase
VALFLLSGLPGSGKTTFAGALLASTDAVHVESDSVRRELYSVPLYTQREHERVFAEVERRVSRALAARRSVAVDATNLKQLHRARYFELAADAHVPVVAIRLVAPYPTLEKRVSGARDGHSQADVNVLRAMRGNEERFAVATLVADTRFAVEPTVALAIQLAADWP